MDSQPSRLHRSSGPSPLLIRLRDLRNCSGGHYPFLTLIVSCLCAVCFTPRRCSNRDPMAQRTDGRSERVFRRCRQSSGTSWRHRIRPGNTSRPGGAAPYRFCARGVRVSHWPRSVKVAGCLVCAPAETKRMKRTATEIRALRRIGYSVAIVFCA
jgi:hypothetical protein